MTKKYTSIKDNRNNGTVASFLKEKIKDKSKLSIVTAYFTIHAYEKLKDKFDNINELRLLFGEPEFIKSIDPSKQASKNFRIENDEILLKNVLEQKRIAKECSDWIKDKVQIKTVEKKGFLHGKMYHIESNGIEDAILGSSNFTVSGLGLSKNPNIELNLEVNDTRDRNDLKHWFNDLWNEEDFVSDVKEKVLEYLEQLYKNQSPMFIYFKTLFHIFEKFLDDQERDWVLNQNKQITETEIWKTLFEFQKDAVKGAINKLNNHNGCIIADSVGLGKTYEGLAVIKYFELLNRNVLVLCPKKLRDNWTIWRSDVVKKHNPLADDRFSYTVMSHTDLSRDRGESDGKDLAKFNWGNYDLLVIDESHNFRNNTKGKKDEDGNTIRKSRYERLMDDIVKSGVKTKVLLLSATPVNTDLSDLRNQINFITEENYHAFSETLDITNYKNTLAAAQKVFTRWSDPKKTSRDVKDLMERLNSDLFKLLDELTIARSRKHIKHYYASEMERIGAFPNRQKPESHSPPIACNGGRFMSYDKLNDEISEYKLSLFSPSKYILEEWQEHYDDISKTIGVKQFTQKDRENYLIGMMKVNFLKRLESSIYSFKITMDRTINKIDNLIKRIDEFKNLQDKNPDYDFDNFDPEDFEDEDLFEATQVGKKLTYNLNHLDLDKWKKDLEKDNDQLTVLYNSAKSISPNEDAKLQKLKEILKEKIEKPTTNKEGKENRKSLIFTAFADTSNYLYDSLKEWAQKELNSNIAMVSGGGKNKTTLGKSEFNEILTNFSPISKHRDKWDDLPQNEEIDTLIGTDCISEGQNLQDCDKLINYDIHWNPVRVIQRYGRIDRIGSLNDKIYLVNFWPTDDLNKYINLKHRVEARMALVDISATTEDNVLEPDKIKDIVEEDLKYRDKQLLRLKKEVLDLEDFNENISITEFTLDDFRMELMNYIEANKDALQNAALGLYAVVPSSINPKYKGINEADKTSIIKPGVIYCLKQKQDARGAEKVNPLQPYYLVYMQEDNTVRFNYVHAKQILEMYRILCSGKKEAYEDLCNLFDQQTSNGQSMQNYNILLQGAINAIYGSVMKRQLKGLKNREAKLIDHDKIANQSEDFELITWLVIK